MVTKMGVKNLMILMSDLTYIYERSRSAFEITPIQMVNVKGKDYILDVLKRISILFNQLILTYPELNDANRSVIESIVYFERKYAERTSRSGFFGGLYVLDLKDAENLSKDTQKWMFDLLSVYDKQITVHIIQSFPELFPDSLMEGYDELINNDLYDAYLCILNGIPTPAVMISFRAAEKIVRQIYEKISGKSSFKVNWGQIIEELKTNTSCPKPLTGFLDYMRDKRNEAGHPDKRYDQEESERILLQIKNLLEECVSLK